MHDTSVSPSLVRLLRDRDAAPRPLGPEAHADALLRAHVLSRIARALSADHVPTLLVKGAALALTVYPSPASRPMGDIDLLVSPPDRDRALHALTRAGFVEHAPPSRARTADLLGEIMLTAQSGAMTAVVELHTTLDKVVPRPIDDRALFARALPAPTLPGLLIPAPEDHALLVALHASGHEFRHPIALLDLELLLRRGLDLDELSHRARAFALTTVMHIAMSTLLSLGAASVTETHVRAFAPSPLRRTVALRCYDPQTIAHASGPNRLGAAWILWQTPLRDDLAAWTRGIARYAALRGLERLGLGEPLA